MGRGAAAILAHSAVDSPSESVTPSIKPVADGAKVSRAGLISLLFALVIAAAIVAGFIVKKRDIFVPGEGLGYGLGLVGGSMMLLLLLYPLIKRTAFFRQGNRAVFWFRWHMILGILGPLLVLFHSNFSTGALNSNVALFAMLVVAASGVIGRYIYSRVHLGLYGARTDLNALLARAARLIIEVERDVGGANGIVAKALADFSSQVLPSGGPSGRVSIASVVAMPFRLSFARDRILRQVKRSINDNAKAHHWSWLQKRSHFNLARRDVDEFLGAVSRAAHMTFWERMFSLWHVAHVPLFFVLFVSGVVHVIAVHLY